MSVYDDDLTLSGAASEHHGFWKTFKQYVNLDPPTEFGRVLGCNHRLVWYQGKKALALESSDCAKLYKDLANKPMKAYSSPHWDDGALIPADDEVEGQLAPHAAKLIMKLMWPCQICRPDVTFAVTPLAKRITIWPANDDKRVVKLIN